MIILIIVCPILYAVYFSWAVFHTIDGQPHKSDQELISNFQAHQSEFEMLRSMALQDPSLSVIDMDRTDPPDTLTIGVPNDRITEYRRLFKRLNLSRGIRRFQTVDKIQFIASSQGYVVHGSSKSYLYTTEPPAQLHDDLDQFSNTNARTSTVYRRIQGNWYIEYECD